MAHLSNFVKASGYTAAGLGIVLVYLFFGLYLVVRTLIVSPALAMQRMLRRSGEAAAQHDPLAVAS